MLHTHYTNACITYLKLHTLRCRAGRQSDATALAKEERSRITQFHAREMDTNTRARTSAKGMESELRLRRLRFRHHFLVGDPALWVETTGG